MHLMYWLDPEGKRVYTLLKVAPDGEATKSAHRRQVTATPNCKGATGDLPTPLLRGKKRRTCPKHEHG